MEWILIALTIIGAFHFLKAVAELILTVRDRFRLKREVREMIGAFEKYLDRYQSESYAKRTPRRGKGGRFAKR